MTYDPGKLIILVGPSGAGKSTYLKEAFPYDGDAILSTDKIRERLCGDFEDQSKNKQVFYALHRITEARIAAGLDTIIDATNLRNADRRALRELVPLNTKIEYHIINRPLDQKLKTGGWRLKVPGLIERHEQTFQSNLTDILAGDNDPRVTIFDLRSL